MIEPDYITVNPAVTPSRFNVVVMRWSQPDDSFRVAKMSETMKKEQADGLALSWAKATGLEIR